MNDQNYAQNLSSTLSPTNIPVDSLPQNERLAIRQDTLSVVRQMNLAMQANNMRELLTTDILQKAASLGALETELNMMFPSENSQARLKYLVDYFTYVSSRSIN